MSALSTVSKWMYIPQSEDELLQAQRLFHGRGHAYEGLEHVTIDLLYPVVLITLFKPEPSEDIDELVVYLRSVFPQFKSVQLQHRYESLGPFDVLWGERIEDLVITEGINKFKITLGKARNTGLFLDMKNGRDWLSENSQNKHVLNLFSYTCGFSVAALSGEAKSVVNVDMAGAALSVGRENHRLNNQDLRQVRFEKLNIFKSFGRFKKRGPFDTLVCDPPTFQKGSVQINRDYPKIMRRLNDFMAPKSTLLLCLNAPELGVDFLIDNMHECAPDYVLKKTIKPPNVYREAQEKGLKTLVFTRG